ncbi:MAG: T9SS type A sorting domain-containing protein [bacterium]|nr:T9SS type A sorting domain-containing protein [bacterium]
MPNQKARLAPTSFGITGVSPNPFNPTTTLSFSWPNLSLVELTVYDVLGRVVMSHQLGMLNAGVHDVVVDGAEWSSGVYFASVSAGEWRGAVKMALVR